MGFTINGYISSNIDASGQTKSGTVTTDTTANNAALDPSQETETYDYTDDLGGAGGNPSTNSDTTANGGTQTPGQTGSENASSYNPSSNGGQGTGGSGPGQQNGVGGSQGGNGSGSNSGVNIDSPGTNINGGGTSADGIDLGKGNNNVSGSGYDGTTPTGGTGGNTSGNGFSTPSGTEVQIVGPDIQLVSADDIPDGATFFHEGKAYVITGHNADGTLAAEDMTEDFTSQLELAGITTKDINRVLSGEITIQELFEEIQLDEDSERFKKIMENSMIQSLSQNAGDDYSFFVFNNMDELNAFIAEKEAELAELIEKRNTTDDHELDAIEMILNHLRNGFTLEEALNQAVAWQYLDQETGEIKYTYENPYGGYYDGAMYIPRTFEEMYGDSEYLDQIREHCYETTKWHLFAEDEIVHKWNNDEEADEYFFEMLDKIYAQRDNREQDVEALNAQIEEVVGQIEYCEWARSYIENEIDYYDNNIRQYTNNIDFFENCSYNPTITEDIESLIPEYPPYSADGIAQVYVNNKADVVKLIVAMANGEIGTSEYKYINSQTYQFISNDPLLSHYFKWLSQRDSEGNLPLTEEEISVINYLYNTQDIDAVYDYLNFLEDTDYTLADKLDERWLYRQQEIDEQFAHDHPIIASIWSVIATPFEGISAAIYSWSSWLTGYKIARCDVYSSGDIMRQTVSADIGEKYGETWQFVYDTGMSMADSAMLIAVTYFTGGAGLAVNTILSATLMGSRAYVSTLNESLDRGLSDTQAIMLATTSAIVETAMESYSLGHLFNLEGVLGNLTKNLTAKVGNVFTNELAVKFVTKLTYCLAGSLSQGIAEGEEEFATEILNTVFDLIIAKDKSKIEVSAAHYQRLGLTDAEIENKLMIDYAGQLWQAFLGGFASGLVFGAFGSAKTTGLTSYGIAHNMYNESINSNASFADQFTQAIDYNQQQQSAAETANESYSLGEVWKQIKSGDIQGALKSLKSGSVLNDAMTALQEGNTLTDEQQKAIEAYKLIQFGLVEQKAKNEITENISNKLNRFIAGFTTPSPAKLIQMAQEYSGVHSLYAGQFNPPTDLSNITREQQVYEHMMYAMIKTGEKLDLSTVGAYQQLSDYIRTGNSSLITRWGDARSILSQYSIDEIRVAYERVGQNVFNDMNVNIQNAIDSIAERCKLSPLEASRLVKAYIQGQQLSDLKFPRNFDYTELEEIKTKYNRFTELSGKVDYSILLEGIQSYNRVIDLQDHMNSAAQQLAGVSQFQTYEDVLTYLTNIAQTGNMIDLSRTIADSTLYLADNFEFARAIERLSNSYYESKQITDVLFNDFWNVLNTGARSDYDAACLLYQTLAISYSKGNQNASQVIKTIMKIKQADPNFHLTSNTYNECFFSYNESRIEMGKNHTAMADQGTIMHELGHALWKYISRETLPISWNSISVDARIRASYNQTSQKNIKILESNLQNINTHCDTQARSEFAQQLMQNRGLTINEYIDKKAASLAKQALIFRNGMIDRVAAELEKQGYSTKSIDNIKQRLSQGKFNAHDAAVEIVNAEIYKISQRMLRTQFSDYCALSDIMDAMFYGQGQTLSGRQLYISFGHFAEYYNQSNPITREITAFHEIIANYTQLKLTGTSDSILFLEYIFGQDFVDLLDTTFTSNIEANKYLTYTQEINFVKISEAIKILDDVFNIKESELPISFSTIDSYHKWFIQELFRNGKFVSTVDTRILEKLFENDIIGYTLVDTIPAHFDFYFEEAINSKLIEPSIFEKMTPTQFITFTNKSLIAAQLFDNITPTQLGNLLTNMGSNTLSWLSSEAIREKILNYNAQQLSEFLDSCEGLNLDAISNMPSNSQWSNLIDNFYGDLISKFGHLNYLSAHPEIASKLKNIIPKYSNSRFATQAYEIVDSFQEMYMYIKALKAGDKNINENIRIIKHVIDLKIAPSSFTTVENFKICFINTLMESDVFNELDNNAIFALIKEPIFLNALAGNAKIVSLLTKNLDNDISARQILPVLTKGTIDSFDKIFDNNAMNQYINNLNASELAILIKRMSDSNNWWLTNRTIMSKITSLNVNEMAQFLDNMGYISKLKESIVNNSDSITIKAFIDKIIDTTKISDFEANPTLFQSLKMLNNQLNGLSQTGNPDLENKIATLIENYNEIKKYIGNKIIASSPDSIASKITFDSLSDAQLEVDQSHSSYNLTIEVNGENQIKTLLATKDFWSDRRTVNLSTALMSEDIIKAINNGTFKIIDISPNIVKETLTISNLQEDGLYQATFVVDGIEYTEIKRSRYKVVDFSYDYKNGKAAELKSLTYLGDSVMNNLDDNKLYRMSYIEDGVSKVLYLTSKQGTIDLNEIITDLKTNKMDFSSLSVEEVTNQAELFAGLKSLTGGIFAGDDYGGNQSNPTSYLTSFFKSNGSVFEMEMGSRISDMIESFFPELATMPSGKAKANKVRLARLYANSGCAYMAFANAVTQYLSSIENGAQIYEKAFGIPMKIDGKYTEEYLAISFCIAGMSEEVHGSLSNFNVEVIDNLGWRQRYVQYITDYLGARGIKVDAKHYDAGTNARASLLSTAISSPGSFHIITGSQFDLEHLSTTTQTGENADAALANSTKVGNIRERVGGHAMLVTEITEAGELIVSSWKGKYRFIPESLSKYKGSRSGMFKVDISLAQNISVPQAVQMENSAMTSPSELSSIITNQVENEVAPVVQDVIQSDIVTKDVGFVRDFLEELKTNPDLTFQEYLKEKTGHDVIDFDDRISASKFLGNPAGILFNIISNQNIAQILNIKLRYTNEIDRMCDDFRNLEKTSPKRNIESLKIRIKSVLKNSGLQLSEQEFNTLATMFAYKGLSNSEINLEQMVSDFKKANEIAPILTEGDISTISSIMEAYDSGLTSKILENLTEAEKNAIFIYTIMDGYKAFQKALNSPNADIAAIYKNELGIDIESSEALASLISAINKNKIPGTIITYQMASDFDGLTKKKQIDVGKSCKIGFKSTTVSLEDIKQIAGQSMDRNIILKIIVPEGSTAAYVEPLSSVGSYMQNEVLLGPNQELMVIQAPYTERLEWFDKATSRQLKKDFVIVPCILY